MKISHLLPRHLIASLTICLGTPLLHAANTEVTVQLPGPPPNATTTDIRLRTDGTVIAKGVTATTTTAPFDEVAAVRMLWHPAKAAFRVGEVTQQFSLDSIIGKYSFAAGFNPKASALSSVAIGDTASAIYTNDIAMGYHASANWGVAIGNQANATYVGYAFGSNVTGYSNAIALGFGAYANYNSSALGVNVSASNSSTAVGFQNTASNNSTALGNFTTATGLYSTSLGYSTSAQSQGSTVIGQLNVPEGTAGANTWNPGDYLFVIGNGTSTTVNNVTTTLKKNAVVVRKNGDMGVQGVLRVWPAGDISMGSFTGGTQQPPSPVAVP